MKFFLPVWFGSRCKTICEANLTSKTFVILNFKHFLGRIIATYQFTKSIRKTFSLNRSEEIDCIYLTVSTFVFGNLIIDDIVYLCFLTRQEMIKRFFLVSQTFTSKPCKKELLLKFRKNSS